MARTYRQAVQIIVSVEADSRDEALKLIDGIRAQVRESLPVGAKYGGALNIVTPA